jgi:hypothetical protein
MAEIMTIWQMMWIAIQQFFFIMARQVIAQFGHPGYQVCLQ